MAPVVRFYLNEEAYEELENAAKESNLTIQDYVRAKCLPPRQNELTLNEVIHQIEVQKPDNEFRLSDLFAPEKWSNVSIGIRAYLGKTFYEKTMANEITNVEFVGMKKRIAYYRLKSK